MNELNISKTLLAKRREKGITQDELAGYMGVSKASVSKWETGQSYPDITFLPQLATYFDISVDELISYEPQMIKEDIRKLYHHLCEEFTRKPFEAVIKEISAINKKYYSCYPLLLQTGTLMVNYFDKAEGQQAETLLSDALNIFVRIRESCRDVKVCHQAKCMEAFCYILTNEPARVIDLMQDCTFPTMNETGLLARGQLMHGQTDKARETMQIGAFQTLSSLIQNLQGLLQCAEEYEQVTETENRIMAIVTAFKLDELTPAASLSIYLTQAQIHMKFGNENAALTALHKYTDLVIRDIYPLTLHGDDFFNRLDDWFSLLDLGINPPRANATIKAGLVAAVKCDPAFAILKDNSKYQFILDKLATLEE